ncbi:ShlB/FhaC/HecB family hemolysin secretion/activation protein [Phenylobacterium terrae]|uniref:ShlB/FhaC/HecB family hemolysin secretion/activation protein n=1 Tax=Phenylobacterium terrae TaxID=2665495 RepID=UPI003671497F
MALALALAAPTLVCAQSGSLVDRDRVDRRPPAEAEPAPAAPEAAAPQRGSVHVEAEGAGAPLRAVRVEGSSLPGEAFEAAVAPLAGRPLTRELAAQAAQAVAKVYEASPVALYSIVVPQQDLSDGRLRVAVIEGRIGEAVVTGATEARAAGLVRAYAGRLEAERPLSRRGLERYLSLSRDIPGVKVTPRIQAGAEPGTARLELEVDPRRYDFELSVGTQGSALLGRTQLQADLNLYSALRPGDHTRLTLGAPTDFERYRLVALTHAQPVGADGLRVQASAGQLRTRPKSQPIRGRATFAGVQASYPVIRGYRQDLYLVGALDGLDSDNAVLGQTITSERTRAARASAAWSRSGKTYAASASATASFGLRGLGARPQPGYSDPGFRKLNLRAGYDRALDERWTVRLRAAGQATPDTLPTSEQFAIGGEQFGRAFEQARATGDHGYGASAEVAWKPKAVPAELKGTEVYAFVDGARTVQESRYGRDKRTYEAASAGAGLRLAYRSETSVGLEAAYGVKDPRTGDEGAWRLNFALSTRR